MQKHADMVVILTRLRVLDRGGGREGGVDVRDIGKVYNNLQSYSSKGSLTFRYIIKLLAAIMKFVFGNTK